MFGEGFTILLLSSLPAILYILIIYATVPYRTIKLKTAFLYLFIGFMSVGFLRYFWMVFPDWHYIAEFFTGADPAVKPLKYYHYYYFVQVAFIEEFAKLMIFFLVERYRRKNFVVKDHPVATMFYMAMISLGFAIIENISYGSNSMDPSGTLYWRSFTAVIGHMIFGLFMGYWIAYGRIGRRLYDRSLFDIVVNKRKKLRNVIYTVIGIGAATIVHGIYDLHLTLQGPAGMAMIYVLLGVGLLGAYWCFKNLNKSYKAKVEANKNA